MYKRIKIRKHFIFAAQICFTNKSVVIVKKLNKKRLKDLCYLQTFETKTADDQDGADFNHVMYRQMITP